jgi:lipopolysaccharide export system protein LptA
MKKRYAFVLTVLTGLILSGGPASSQAFKGHNTRAEIDIQSDRQVIETRSKRGVFTGNVVVQQADLTIRASSMTILYGGGAASRIEASGNVRITRGNESAQSGYALYEPRRSLITLNGGVLLNKGGNVMRGGRLVIDMGSGKATVDGNGGAAPAAPGAPAPTTNPNTGRVSGRINVSGQ